jgi:4,5-DOPA dioxygenase extradiol
VYTPTVRRTGLLSWRRLELIAHEPELLDDHPAAAGLEWRAPGDPTLADALLRQLRAVGVDAVAGSPRLDHGAWVPLRALDAAGRRPVVTLSLAAGLDADAHLALGQALAPLRDDAVAVVASGGVTHNQNEFRRAWFAGAPLDAVTAWSGRFEAWALDALAEPEPARAARLLGARAHADFALAHPTIEHWLPALVAAGAARGDAARVLHRGFQHSLSTALVAFGA